MSKTKWGPGVKRSLFVRRYGELADFVMSYRKLHGGKLPWEKSYSNSHARCSNPREPKYKYYGGKGIKNFLTREDIKNLYFRDRAWEMEIPSLDRINSDDHYTIGNCRFIEFSLNRVLRGKKSPIDKRG